ncbi:hypothetical protein PHMEG_00020945 [Phytophthora megakarya]|uniref:Uncharacterized protein n=1 Tax=Phytophthora megakarya TaxID=4795 RepID=A0A225VQE8_9STRA|nr:hypothetical protein PHMEG_00020945 [Phytophthora megakarya]
MDVDETSWIRIQPYSGRTLIETCSRQIPVQYLQNNADTSATKVFWNMLQDAVKEDEHEFFRAMGKLRREDANSHVIRLISE